MSVRDLRWFAVTLGWLALAVALMVLGLILIPSVFGTGIKPPEGFDREVYNSSFVLWMHGALEDGTPSIATCSANTLEKVKGGYLLLSAGHCTSLNEAAPRHLLFTAGPDLDRVEAPVDLLACEYDEDGDWAVFYLKTPEKFPVLSLGDESDVAIGDEVVTVNFTYTLAKYLLKGNVASGIATVSKMRGLFAISTEGTKGGSGSEIVSVRTHKVIGILTQDPGGKAPLFVEPISVIKKQMKMANLQR